MNHDELFKQLLENEEGKKLIEQYVESQKAPLVNKRDELLGELKSLKKNSEVMQMQLKELQSAQAPKKEEPAQPEQKVTPKEEHLVKELENKEKTINSIKQSLIREKVDVSLTKAIEEHKGISELLKPHLNGRIKADYSDNGEIVITILDQKGNPMFKNGEPASITDLVEEYKSNAIFGRAFESSGVSGSGTRGNGSGTKPTIELDPTKEGYSVAAAMQYYKANPGALKRK